MICVVNKYVGKKIGMTNSKKQYSHVNFWATRENEGRPTLFFAQFSNDEDSANHYSICYPVTGLSTHDGMFSSPHGIHHNDLFHTLFGLNWFYLYVEANFLPFLFLGNSSLLLL